MRIECTLDNDPRLIAGLGALISQAGRHAGLTQEDGESVAIAAMQTCREAFAQAHRRGSTSRTGKGRRRAPAVRITLSDLRERVEVTVEYAGKALPEARQNLLRGCAANGARGSNNLPHCAHVEHLRFEASEGRCRVTLTKYCGAVKAGLKD
jgi:hypothetical protein